MRLKLHRKALLLGACIFTGWCAFAESPNQSLNTSPKAPTFEVAIDFNAARANTVSAYDFWMQGGGAQFSGNFTRHWAAAADFSFLHTGQLPHTTAGLDLTTVVFGPRYSLNPTGHLKIYGHAMGGFAHGSNSIFPGTNGTASSATGSALLMGGGADYRVVPHLSVRILEADWLRTTLSNGTTTVQNNLRIGSGITFRF